MPRRLRDSRHAFLPGLEAAPAYAQLGDAEIDYEARGVGLLVGIDEAGRGPLAGPVVAAAVLWPAGLRIPGLNDSKKLSPKARAALEPLIKRAVPAYGVGFVSPAEIDRLNILQASKRAWQKALDLAERRAGRRADFVLVDGNQALLAARPHAAIVKGDALSYAVAAASILAKEARDRVLRALDVRYPGYDLARHKGYPTPAHLAALRRLGPSPCHRLSFQGVLPPAGEDAQE